MLSPFMSATTETPTLARTSSAVERARSWIGDPQVQWAAIAALAGFVLYRATAKPGGQNPNTYVWLADAFLHGRLDILNPGAWLETVTWNGRHYSHQGPLPGVLLMPFIAVFKLGFDLRWFAALAGGAASAGAWVTASRVGLRGPKRVGAWAFMVGGTSLWFEAKEGSTWGVAAVVTVVFLLWSLAEYFGRRRPWLIGLLVGMAGLSRPTAFLALAGFLWALRRNKPHWLIVGAFVPAVFMVGYNFARFGSLFDRSIEIHYLRDNFRFQRPPGMFSLAHIPFNLYSWFLLAPQYQPTFPYLRPTLLGTGLPYTSPAFVNAFGARRERWMWICAVAVVVPAAVFYANGFAQFGMRYLLDAMPFVFGLVCMALVDGRAPGFWFLVTASVAANALGVFYTNAYGLKP